jgi:hypothetical protein
VGFPFSKETASLKGSDKSQPTSQDKTKFPHPSKDREQVVMTTEGENIGKSEAFIIAT